MTDDELKNAVENYPDQLSGYCTLVIQNDSKVESWVTIDIAAVNFLYDDGTTDSEGPRRVDLRSGQQGFFYSHRENGCVKRISWSFRSNSNGAKKVESGSLEAAELNGSKCWNAHIVNFATS